MASVRACDLCGTVISSLHTDPTRPTIILKGKGKKVHLKIESFGLEGIRDKDVSEDICIPCILEIMQKVISKYSNLVKQEIPRS